MHSLSRMHRRDVVRLAPAKSRQARDVRRSVRERAGCRGSGSWNGAGSGVPGGVQFNADESRRRRGTDITHIDVGVLTF